ncbi:MAG: hypothetical protein QM753_14040 [Thermomicrobiales bacterium]
MRVTRWMSPWRSAHRMTVTLVPMLALRDRLPVVPTPRDAQEGVPWRPVLFGLGAAVGFAVALSRVRTAQAPDLAATATSSGGGSPRSREDGSIARSLHLPTSLTESIEAELTQDGPVLFSPPDAIDPVGSEGLEADANADDRLKGDA